LHVFGFLLRHFHFSTLYLKADTKWRKWQWWVLDDTINLIRDFFLSWLPKWLGGEFTIQYATTKWRVKIYCMIIMS
jgi:hypothetical protein